MEPLKIGDVTVAVPIIQGGMGVGVSLSGLAVAVANEGGVGVISSAGLGLLYRDLSPDYPEANSLGLSEEIKKARKSTDGVIGVNIMVAMSNFADLVATSIREKIDIIFAGAGLPLNLPSYREKDSLTKLAPIVSSGRAARIILEKWDSVYQIVPDAIVVEGPKAGGHLGFRVKEIFDDEHTLDRLVRDVCREVTAFEEKYGRKIPVIAAGGIYTGADIYAIMAAGASGVQMGTRFVTTYECDASETFKQAYIKAKASDIEIINSPVGMPGRAIINSFIDKVRQGKKHPLKCPFKCIKTCDVSSSPYCIITALFNAFKGNLEAGFAFAGSNAFRATQIQSVREVFQELIAEFTVAQKVGI
ncbi:MAG TPA: nitronate monooxygenase family protein [Bacteroidales bacterium]|nr:nitronate monooxygenase family protein [Bacteroidales bacterium]